MRHRTYWVYIMASRSRVLYIGVTRDLIRRGQEHRAMRRLGFTARYRVTRLVWFESYTDVWLALAREKQLKGWRRSKKVGLIEAGNLGWEDLYDSFVRDWYS